MAFKVDESSHLQRAVSAMVGILRIPTNRLRRYKVSSSSADECLLSFCISLRHQQPYIHLEPKMMNAIY